jgi:hypothetical protein
VDFRDPGQVLAELNQVFKMEDHNDMFFTIWYGVYHKRKGEILYACGGHPPAIAMTGETPETAQLVKLSGEGFIIGAVPEKKYASFSLLSNPFTRLYVFSDGIYEVDGCEGKVCMFDDFVSVVVDLYRDDRAHVENIIHTMRARQGKTVFDDDVSLLEIEFARQGDEKFRRHDQMKMKRTLLATSFFCMLFPAVLMSVSCAETKQGETQWVIGGPCKYRSYAGTAKVVSVERADVSQNGAKEDVRTYDVQFIFQSENVPKDIYERVQGKRHPFLLTNGSRPTSGFLKKYGISKGKSLPCELDVIVKGTCTPRIFKFPNVDLTDYDANR